MDAPVETLLSHRAWVRALASALAQPADADDLEQETWLAALSRPPDDAAPKAWLATVLRRTASKLRRALARRATRERVAARPEATAATADLVARAETHDGLVRAVLALPEPYRSTILLRFFEGLLPKEIARRTATPIDTVKARLRRGLARLRADLPEDRALAVALLAVAVPRRPLASGALAMMLKTKLSVAATALLVAGSFVTYRALDRTQDVARAPSAPDATMPAPESARGGPEPATPEANSLPAERRDFLVAGSVRGARAFMPYAVGEVNGKRELLPPSESAVSADGRFATRLPFLAAQPPWEIDFGVLGDGFVRAAQRLAVEPGGEYEVDFVVVPGVGIEGAVADADGKPVAGLAILAVGRKTPPWGLATALLLDTERLLVKPSLEHFARGATDALGRFEIQGLAPGTYALFGCSEEWILDHDALEAPAGDARVVAVPAHAVTGTIRDARCGATVAMADVGITVRTPSGWGCWRGAAAPDGRLWIAWKPQQPEIEEGFDATLKVSAAGYRAAERVLPFPRGTRRVSADFQLEPVEAEDLAVIRLEVTDTRGRLVEEELSCTLSALNDPELDPTAKEFRPVAPGVFELRAQAGAWSVTLQPRRRMGEPLAWSGAVELGRDERVRCALPPFGVVRLRCAGAGSWIAVAQSTDGKRSCSWQVETREVRLAAPPGEWRVGGGPGDVRIDPGGEGLRTVLVLDGVETVVDLE